MSPSTHGTGRMALLIGLGCIGLVVLCGGGLAAFSGILGYLGRHGYIGGW